MKTWDLLGNLTLPQDAHGLAQRTLDSALAFVGGQAAALFRREQERLVLFASRGIDQGALDLVGAAWRDHRASLIDGRALAEAEGPGKTGYAILPVSEAARLVGVLYVRAERSRLVHQRDIEGLAQFCGIAATALTTRGVETYLEVTAPDDIERQQLLILLARHEWNLARVARELKVTRATIYNRLSRLGIKRRKQPRLAPRRQPT